MRGGAAKGAGGAAALSMQQRQKGPKGTAPKRSQWAAVAASAYETDVTGSWGKGGAEWRAVQQTQPCSWVGAGTGRGGHGSSRGPRLVWRAGELLRCARQVEHFVVAARRGAARGRADAPGADAGADAGAEGPAARPSIARVLRAAHCRGGFAGRERFLMLPTGVLLCNLTPHLKTTPQTLLAHRNKPAYSCAVGLATARPTSAMIHTASPQRPAQLCLA